MLRVHLVKLYCPWPTLCHPFRTAQRSYASKESSREWKMDLRSERHMERFIAMKEEEALQDLKNKVQLARDKVEDLHAIIQRLENIRIDQQPDIRADGKSKAG